jgi:hypothetical protein
MPSSNPFQKFQKDSLKEGVSQRTLTVDNDKWKSLFFLPILPKKVVLKITFSGELLKRFQLIWNRHKNLPFWSVKQIFP